MRQRPRLLDLFCGAGGASAGFFAAGFDVTGVDLVPQPHYPFPFVLGDALEVDLAGYDVVAASPPCQRYSAITPSCRREDHPDLIDPIRQRLREALTEGTISAYVIENVPGAPLIDPVLVCGDTLRLGVRRHRLFEASMPLTGTGCFHDRAELAVPVYGSHGQRRQRASETVSATAGQGREAMGIGWMPWPALTQAVPPAYTLWVGTQLRLALGDETRRPLSSRPARDESPSTGRDERGLGWGDESSLVQGAYVTGDGIRRCHCGQPLTRQATGRWPSHCSHACRQAAYRARRADRAKTR